jgi:hypothetical protein
MFTGGGGLNEHGLTPSVHFKPLLLYIENAELEVLHILPPG